MRGSLIILASAVLVSGCFPVQKENTGTPTNDLPPATTTPVAQALPGPTQPAWRQPDGRLVQAVTPARSTPMFIDLTKSQGVASAKPTTQTPAGPNAVAQGSLPFPTAPGTVKLGALPIPLPGTNPAVVNPASMPLPGSVQAALEAATRTSTPTNSQPIHDPNLQTVAYTPPGQGSAKNLIPSQPSPFPVPPSEVKDLGTPEGSAAPLFRLVNTKTFSLGYQVEEAGSGINSVEVWSTKDMKNWEKVPAEYQKPSSYRITVADEGVYGYTLVPRGKNGTVYRSPKAGDSPQVWVTVDLTKPVVELQGVELSLTTEKPSLVVRWKAADSNFGRFPISLHYAEEPEGPWTPLVANLKNSGRTEWPISTHLPRRIYIRVEAVDQTGNVGAAQTEKWVRIEQPWPPKGTLAQQEGTPTPNVVPVSHPVPAPAIEQVPPRIQISTVEPNN